MSQDISRQVTEGILNAFLYLCVIIPVVILTGWLLETFWVLIVLLVVSSIILGLLGWGFWVFAKNHKTLVLWVSVAIVLIVGLIALVANNLIQF